MVRIIRLIVSGMRGVGMTDGIYSIYHANPPHPLPEILNCEEAAEADSATIGSDYMRIQSDFSRAYEKEVASVHV